MNQFHRQSKKYIVGIDEAGRGPLAGPVVVTALVFYSTKCNRYFKGVKDSKKISEQKRNEWFKKINEAKEGGLLGYAVSFSSEKIIDKEGIVPAIKKALKRSLDKLELNPLDTRILLDGGLCAPLKYKNQKTIIKGDEKMQAIALASIISKVSRDKKMYKLAKQFPKYGFENHKGYGTKKHYEAIRKYKTLPIHRLSFLKKIGF